MLVTVEPDAVTEPVDEELAVSGVADHGPRRGVDLLRGDALAGRGIAGLLRAPHDVVHARDFVARPADVDRARDVRAVPGTGTAEVEGHRIVRADTPLRGVGVGRRAVLTRRDDRAHDLVMALIAEERGEIVRGLESGAYGEV